MVDLSEKRPADDKPQGKRSSIAAPDCLTIEEEDAESIQVEAYEYLSFDNESSKISSPRSKPLSKKHLFVDELSADGEEKRRKRFDNEVILIDHRLKL